MAYRTLIFDFDGTLADTLKESVRIYNELAPDYNLRQISDDELPDLRQLSFTQVISHLNIPKRYVPAIITRGTLRLRKNLLQTKLIPGIAEMIPQLRNRCQAFGILTSNSAENVDAFLRAHGLRRYFNFISTTAAANKLTSKTLHLRAIRKNFSLKAKEMLYIGDEIRDLKASRKASVDFAAVTWGYNSREALIDQSPDFLIDTVAQFLTLDCAP